MRLPAMYQVMVKVIRIGLLDRGFAVGLGTAKVPKDMRCVVIDNNDQSV